MMYASPIVIKREPQKVRYHKRIELPDELMTLEELSKYVSKDESFGFSEIESSQFGCKKVLEVFGYRLETDQEVADRVSKAEAYNEKYKDFHAKYGRK